MSSRMASAMRDLTSACDSYAVNGNANPGHAILVLIVGRSPSTSLRAGSRCARDDIFEMARVFHYFLCREQWNPGVPTALLRSRQI
jgi:hypothetical protein